MIRRLLCAGMLVSAFGVPFARNASAQITAVNASGPGGTVTDLAFTSDNIQYSADYTSRAEIDFFITVSGPGTYDVGFPIANVTNSTGSLFSSFYAYLVDAPAGSTFNSAGWNSNVFSNDPIFIPPFPNTTELLYSGAPGLAAGDTTIISAGFQIPAADSGTQSVEVILTPAAIPEPSSFVLGLIGTIAGLGYCVRRFRRQG
jgi:hypothetical protein